MKTENDNESAEIIDLRKRIAKMEKKAKKAKKAKKQSDKDDFQGIWMQKGENGLYPGGVIITPKGEKVWICIFPNRYYTKKGKWPAYHVTVNVPKTKTKK